MKFNAQFVIYLTALLIGFSCIICMSSAAPMPASDAHLKVKRSPYLRLDELSAKIYLAKNRLGGGSGVDPFEIGKRSASSSNDDQINLAVVVYDGLSECIIRDECSKALKLLLEN